MKQITVKQLFKKYRNTVVTICAVGTIFGLAMNAVAQNDLQTVDPKYYLYALLPVNVEFGTQSMEQDVSILNAVKLPGGNIEIHLLINDKTGKLNALMSKGISNTIYVVCTQIREGSDLFVLTHKMPIEADNLNR